MFRQQKKKDETPAEAAERAGRAAKERPNTVKGIQDFAAKEAERKRKEEEEKKKKKPQGVDTAPSKGILQRIYESVMGSSEDKR